MIKSSDGSTSPSEQPTGLQSACVLNVPQKVGEVYAGLRILLASKIIDCKEGDVIKAQKVNGFLLDKHCGLIHCSVRFEDFNLPLKVEVTRYVGGALTSSQICKTMIHANFFSCKVTLL